MGLGRPEGSGAGAGVGRDAAFNGWGLVVGGWWLVNIWELMLIFWGLVAFLSGMPF